jgi:hypothetical protein
MWSTGNFHEIALCGSGAALIQCEPRARRYRYLRSTAHAVEVFMTSFGPSLRVLGVIGND